MKIITPSYYSEFKCIAQQCRHNCCIGWEIDVDPQAMAWYAQYPQIMSHIRDGAFVLDTQERCPFLNQEGLCTLILTYGEESLCQICRDHPRFRNVFSDRVEMGLGLCCEAAARLVLSQQEPMQLTPFAGDPTPEERQFFNDRRQLFTLLQDRTLSFDQRLTRLFGGPLPDAARWVPVYRQLERLDPAWDALLDTVGQPRAHDAVALEQLTVYFLYRHLADGLAENTLDQRRRFAVLSVQMIRSVDGELADAARMYSAEIEYSDQNLQILLSLLEKY